MMHARKIVYHVFCFNEGIAQILRFQKNSKKCAEKCKKKCSKSVLLHNYVSLKFQQNVNLLTL